MARKPVKLPDYFTAEESQDLVDAAPSYPVRMAMRIMLRTGLRVGECLSLRPQDIRLRQDPPIISLRPDVTGNKAKKGREAPIPADLASSLADMVSMRARGDRQLPLFDVSRQWVSKSMKEAAVEAGLDTGRAHPQALRHTYGRNAVLNGVPTPVLQQWLGHRSLAETEHRILETAGYIDDAQRLAEETP